LKSLLIGTVVAKNYLPFARVLAGSLRRHHPDARFVVALSDELDGHVDRSAERFPIITPRELGVPDLRDLAFRSGQREFAIALKPYLVEYMAADAGSALFLDADTLVVGDLEPLFDSVQGHALTLVPHRLVPPATDGVARDLVLNLAGIFNGGVVGITHQASSTDFVRWWQARVHQLCVYAVDRGIHYDQRWLDLALGFVEDLHIHRDPGVNVAHWNLPERPIHIRDGAITAGGEPCRLFHFSGFDPDDPKTPSRYLPELRLADVGEAARLFGDYARELDREGWPVARRLPYAYGSFDNGVPIPEAARRLFAQIPDRAKFGDPFNATARNSYFNWLRKSPTRRRALRGPSRLSLSLHRQRADIRRAFPDRFHRTKGATEATVPPDSPELGPDSSQRMPRWP
jgi:hypothetical protein